MKMINNQNVKCIDVLLPLLEPGADVMLCACYFSINAFYALYDSLNVANSIRILLDVGIAEEEARLSYDPAEWSIYHRLQGQYKARKVAELITNKVRIRAGKARGKKFILVRNKGITTYFGITPEDFNLICLGTIASDDSCIIDHIADTEGEYLTLFNRHWDNSKLNIKQSVISHIERAYESLSPQWLYQFTIHHLFQNSVSSSETNDRITKTGFKDTEVWKMLYNFQQDAVLGAIDKIETYGGCIIADSVGLGKTFEALAVMKYYQLRNNKVLVLCPKKLKENWIIYKQTDVRNILEKDRMNFDVLLHSDLSRKEGYSGDINLSTVNWGNYDLIVIDESHNFRNNDTKLEGNTTRYQKLLNEIIKAGVKSKVLMLSATPVNTRMTDLKNQIAFITERHDDALASHGISSISETLRKAQLKFNNWLKNNQGGETNRDSLIDSLDGAYFKLLDLLTIARSRRHIEKYYDTKGIGKFPDRLKPISIYPSFDTQGNFPEINEVNDQLQTLKLQFYSLLSYVNENKRKGYEERYDKDTSTGLKMSQLHTENNLINLMRVNLLKRLESSVCAFQFTLEALLKQINELHGKVEKALQENIYNPELDINNIDFDDEQLEEVLAGGKVKVLLQDIDLYKCKQDLNDDKRHIEALLAQTRQIEPARDAKMAELKSIIAQKVANPINDGNKKIIIFSAFSDTVKYLYNELREWIKNELGLYSALITGTDNKTNLPDIKTDLNTVLTHFSPISKNRSKIAPKATAVIDLLFCTDCISEGQNLQDCDYLINYDIHWNPVRIIQRFGRIDRIGSKNNQIQLVNFFPNLDLDQYIDLIGRVRARMHIVDASATGDDNIIDTSANKQDLEYRKKQLTQLKEKVMDLEDIEGGISITDLTFNDYKIEADHFAPPMRTAFNLYPKGIFALTYANISIAEDGIIFCVKKLNNNAEGSYAFNAISPYCLGYITTGGDMLVAAQHPKRCLDYYKRLCAGQSECLNDLIASFNKETKKGLHVGTYTALLQSFFTHIKGAESDMGVNSLAFPGGTQLFNDDTDAQYELISYLIVKKNI
ncbi:MAG: DEAD/DEAH box helicase [Chitinophagia bacterium]|nr:DEAD/DEAH box helicase [Chitinophagia bacterium]